MTRQKSNRRQGPGPACTYYPQGVRGGVAGAGSGQGPCTHGARKLHILPLHDWPLWPRGLMGWSSPSQSGAPGSPFIHKKSRRKRSAARPEVAWNFEVRARLVEPLREYRKLYRWKLDSRRDRRFPVHSSGPATGYGVSSSRATSPRAPPKTPLGHACRPAPAV